MNVSCFLDILGLFLIFLRAPLLAHFGLAEIMKLFVSNTLTCVF